MTRMSVFTCAETPRTGHPAHLCRTGPHRYPISRSKPVRAQIRTGVHGTCACARRSIAGTGAQPAQTHSPKWPAARAAVTAARTHPHHTNQAGEPDE